MFNVKSSKGLVRKFITTCTCTTNIYTRVVSELDVQGFSINGSIPLILVKNVITGHISCYQAYMCGM